MTPYEVLGVPVGASVEEIRRAYLVLARQHHPDFHTGESSTALDAAGRQMQVLNEAWAALSDPAVRRRYEREQKDEVDNSFRPFSPPVDDEPDPRDAPDVPYRPQRPPTPLERALVLIPVALFALAGLSIALSMITGDTELVALAVVCFVLSCVGFLVVPLLALGRAAKDEG
ncbi:MAG TPA: J domain-containing protein [Acidimicrobiales bacterium]